MPRLRNVRSGVVVSVDDDTAARLGSAYEPVEGKPAPKRAAKRAATRKSDTED